MSPNKTLYVRDADGDIWDQAERYAAGRRQSLSSVVAEALRHFLPAETEIRVEVGGEPTQTQAFFGRWLVEPHPDRTRTVVDGYDTDLHWGVALTRRGQIAVYTADYYGHVPARLETYPTLDEAEKHGVPGDIISMAAHELGEDRVTRLDI